MEVRHRGQKGKEERTGCMRTHFLLCCTCGSEKQPLRVCYLLPLWEPRIKIRLSGLCSVHFCLPCLVVLGDARQATLPLGYNLALAVLRQHLPR